MLCIKCSKFPFCKQAEKNKTDCNDFIKRGLDDEVRLFEKNCVYAQKPLYKGQNR